MKGYIDGFNFLEAQAMKYWSFPASYSKERRTNELHNMLYSNDYIASEKRDGYWQMVLKDEDNNIFMRARNSGVNGWVCKQDWVPHLHDFFDALPTGTCLICEIYIPGKTSKDITTILGCKAEKAIERQAKNKLYLSVFDVIAWDGRDISKLPIMDRVDYLDKLPKHQYVTPVTYWYNPQIIYKAWLDILNAGGEGVVLVKKNSPYAFGKRTARQSLKLKKELQDNLEVFLTGRWKKPTREYSGIELSTWPYFENEITGEKVFGSVDTRVHNEDLTAVTKYYFNNWAAAIEIAVINKDGKIMPIGWISNIPDEVRAAIVEDPDSLKGKVVEIQAMDIDTTGSVPTLRHAKIINWRSDKTWQECIWNG